MAVVDTIFGGINAFLGLIWEAVTSIIYWVFTAFGTVLGWIPALLGWIWSAISTVFGWIGSLFGLLFDLISYLFSFEYIGLTIIFLIVLAVVVARK